MQKTKSSSEQGQGGGLQKKKKKGRWSKGKKIGSKSRPANGKKKGLFGRGTHLAGRYGETPDEAKRKKTSRSARDICGGGFPCMTGLSERAGVPLSAPSELRITL